MSIDRSTLIELYEINLEEARHHDRLYTQIWIAALIIVSVGGTLIFIFASGAKGEISPLGPELPTYFKWLMIILGLVLGYFVIRSVSQHTVEGDSCRDIANQIESFWAGKAETIEIRDLLVVQKRKELRGQRYKQLYAPIIRQPGKLVYLAPPLLLWIYLWWQVL